MNPNNRSQGGGAVGPAGSQPPQDTTSQHQQTAAASVLRSQIDALYGDNPVATPVADTTASQQAHQYDAANPYDRTHSANPQAQADQWKAYHTAWQEYYQKYYAAYYEQQQAIKEQTELARRASESQLSQNPNDGRFYSGNGHHQEGDMSKDQALYELREQLLGKVRKQATKIRRSRHFLPVAAALLIVLIFVFVQYNRVFIASVSAYVSPGSIDPQNIVIDPTADLSVSPDPRLIIPKINVDVPVVYGVTPDHTSQMKAMEKGVAHFAIPGAKSRPGEVGNTVLSGHSSNDLFDPGDYKFIFAQLDKLGVGDTIYANYKGKRYTYVVTKTEVVKPTDVQKLVYPTKKPVLTLITCTPLGTALNRLLVTAEQVSPDPAKANAAPKEDGAKNTASIPGSTPTFLERLFGAE